MQLSVDQLLLLVHEALAKYPASMAYNHARRKLGQARDQIASSGMGHTLVDLPGSERVVPTQDFGTSSPTPSVEPEEPVVVEDVPTEEPVEEEDDEEPQEEPTYRTGRRSTRRAAYKGSEL